MKKSSDRIDRIERIYMFLLRLQMTLSNLVPLSAKTITIRRTIRFVPFFRKGTKIKGILLILSKKVF